MLDGTVMRALSGGWWQFVAAVADGETGTDLTVVTLLADIDPRVLDDADRVDLIRAWERCRAMLDGAQQRALCAVADATEGRGLAEQEARHEVGAALRLSPPTAGERTWVATSLRRRLPATLAALELVTSPICRPRTWSPRSVRSTTLPPPVEARVLARASEQTVAEFRRSVTRAVIAVDPASATDGTRRPKRPGPSSGCRSPTRWRLLGHHARRHRPRPLGHPDHRAKAEQAARQQAGLPDPGIGALRLDVLVHAILHNGGADPDDPLITTTASNTTNRGTETGTGQANSLGCRSAAAAARSPRRW